MYFASSIKRFPKFLKMFEFPLFNQFLLSKKSVIGKMSSISRVSSIQHVLIFKFDCISTIVMLVKIGSLLVFVFARAPVKIVLEDGIWASTL